MPNKKILVPVDFTGLSDKVIEQAASKYKIVCESKVIEGSIFKSEVHIHSIERPYFLSVLPARRSSMRKRQAPI